MINLKSYFDLNSGVGRRTRKPSALDVAPKSPKYVLPQYLALVLGVIIQPFLQSFQKDGHWPDLGSICGRLVFGIIVGILIFPGVYKNAWDPEKPLFVQLCAIVASGLGWQTLLATAIPGVHR